jgi:hypothetical protein
MPTGRMWLAAGAIKGVLYTVGGHNFQAQHLGTTEAYRPEGAANRGESVKMPEARFELARGCPRWILSPLRLPFRHSGAWVRYTARRLRGHPTPR